MLIDVDGASREYNWAEGAVLGVILIFSVVVEQESTFRVYEAVAVWVDGEYAIIVPVMFIVYTPISFNEFVTHEAVLFEGISVKNDVNYPVV